MNKIRERLARAVEDQGGYHSRDSSFALEYCVGLYSVSNAYEDLLAGARSINNDEFELFMEPDDNDMSMFYTQAQESLSEAICDKDNDSYKQYTKTTAIKYGLSYEVWPKKFTKERAPAGQWYEKKGKGYITNSVSTTFDATYGLYGRGGKHLCIEEFEGRTLEVSNEELAERLRDDESCAYHNYTNQWCRRLLAAMEEWEVDFTSKKASEAMQEQMAWEMSSWSEWAEHEAIEAALVP
jgi:hypothetical protein